MAQTIKLKRSATAGNTPGLNQLELGEIAINTADGKMFIKRDDGTANDPSIVEVGSTGSFLPLSGGSLTGNLNLGDNVKAQFGAGNELQIYHDGSRSYISDQGTGGLRLLTNELSVMSPDESENLFFSVKDGSTYLYQNSSIKLQTTSTGISISNDANFPDNGKAIFGAGDDLQIYHDGNHSRIVDSGTGHLVLASSQIHALNAGQNEVMFNAIENAQVELYYDGTKKFETTTAGATVTGTISDSKGELRKLIPNTQAGAYTLVASDAGKYIWASGAVTVPNNIFSAGDMVTIVNDTNGNLTITNSLSVMYMSSDGTNAASRTLGAYGMATLLFVSGTAAYISGAGLS